MAPESIAALISAAAGIGGKAYGDITAKKNAEKQEGIIKDLKQQKQNWYDRRYNEDFTQRADAQRVLQQAKDTLAKRNKAAQGRAAVMGSTNEAVAAEKAANNEAYAAAVSRVAAAGAASKDAIEQQYNQQNMQLSGQIAGMYGDRAANAALGGAQALQGAGSLIGEFLKDKEGK